MEQGEYISLLQKRVDEMEKRVETNDFYKLSYLEVVKPYNELHTAIMYRVGVSWAEYCNKAHNETIEYEKQTQEHWKKFFEAGIEDFSEVKN